MSTRDDSPAETTDLLGQFDAPPAPSRVPRVLMWSAVTVVVLGGAYVGAQWAVADQVAASTTVAGIDIGGMSRTDAVEALEDGLPEVMARPLEVKAGEKTGTVDPVAAGLAVDVPATVDELTGFDLAPMHLWDAAFGGGEADPVVTVDAQALSAEVELLAETLAVPPVDGTVVFADGEAYATPAQNGYTVDTDEAQRRIAEGWLVAPEPIDLPVGATRPAVTQDMTDAALAQAEALVSAPISVEVEGQVVQLPTDVVADAASFTPVDGQLKLALAPDAMAEAVRDRTKDLETEASNARFVFKDGKPVIRGGEPGKVIDGDAIAAAVVEVGTTAGAQRTATVALAEATAESSREALEKLGVNEVVAEFSTPLGASNAARIHNLELGTSKVNGQLVLPGETWSLIDTLSPITAENGYLGAGIVSDGSLTEGVGGGLSQLATTTYNVGYLLGYDDVEHRQHNYYFSRYPEGREATIFVGSIDMRFKNDTPYGMLLQSYVRNGEVTVRAWSTEHYKVESSTTGRSNVRQPTTVYDTGAGCIAQPAGNPGFSVVVTRRVLLDGKVVKEERDPWTYQPQNAVVCKAAPKKDDKKDD